MIAARRCRGATNASSGAASAKRATVSQPPGEPVQDELGQRDGEPPQEAGGDERDERGMTAKDRHDTSIVGVIRMKLVWIRSVGALDEIFFRSMAIQLDEIDVRLLKELETDADRPNVELARIVGLSPAATLNRVRRLKESGVIRRISGAAGLRHRRLHAAGLPAGHARPPRRARRAALQRRGAALDNIISADTVAGETDAILMIVARDVAELHVVLSRLSTRGGAQRLITLLRLAELKPSSPLPLRATSVQSRRAA